MSWNSYYGAYLGQDPVVRDRRDERSPARERGERPPARDNRGGRPLSPWSQPHAPQTPRPVEPDPRVTTPPFPLPQPDPRVTTRPEDLRPRRDRDDRDDRDDRRRPRHPRYRHQDYIYVTNYGWWPRWYPYWDPQWFMYWRQLYDYYGGDAYPEYAEWARDEVLRAMAPQRGWL
jgi:hypothetical protein